MKPLLLRFRQTARFWLQARPGLATTRILRSPVIRQMEALMPALAEAMVGWLRTLEEKTMLTRYCSSQMQRFYSQGIPILAATLILRWRGTAATEASTLALGTAVS